MSFGPSNEFASAASAEVISKLNETMPELKNGLPRWVEATIAFIGLIIAAPFMMLTAVAIVVSSGRPVFFRQRRVGQNGRMFDLYKLRTMRSSSAGPQITSSRDERITPVGRFLRRTKLDELPTLWNVLRGDMALVGPRPEVPRYVDASDRLWRAVLSVKPGITDPVTLRLRREEDLLARVNGDALNYYVKELQPAKLRGYLAYLEQRNWRTDLSVLWQTVAAVVIPGKASALGEAPYPRKSEVAEAASMETSFSNDRSK